jgi:hypothetical protein
VTSARTGRRASASPESASDTSAPTSTPRGGRGPRPRGPRSGPSRRLFRQLHCDLRRMHLGLLLPGAFRGARRLWHSMPRKSREESISSLKLTAAGLSRASSRARHEPCWPHARPQLSGHPLGCTAEP